jgi:hypothetical protein
LPPPEDCGGVWGYEELIEILSDPKHPEHEERLDWSGEFDPECFDVAETTSHMQNWFSSVAQPPGLTPAKRSSDVKST